MSKSAERAFLEFLRTILDMEDEPEKDMTPEHDAQFKDWFERITTGSLEDVQAVITESIALHRAEGTHDYKGLCQRLRRFHQMTAYVGDFRFGEAYEVAVRAMADKDGQPLN